VRIQTPPHTRKLTAHYITSILDEFIAKSQTPGIQYLAVDGESTRFEFTGGLADVGRQVRMTEGTTMMAYSMSKTVTAVAVLQLVEAGKIGLDDAIDGLVEFNPYGKAITVRQLLSHTAGVPNPIPLRWVHTVASHDSFDERSAFGGVLRAHSRLSSAPGSRYAYSNIGYWLLGGVVEEASGSRFTEFVEERVLKPLGIAESELGYTIPDADRHAGGYLDKFSGMNLFKRLFIGRELIGGYERRWLRIGSHYVNGPAFGGLVGTARGWGEFLQDQLRPQSRLLGDSARGLLREQQRTHAGRLVPMTLGWHIGALGNLHHYYKEGGGGGFHAMMRVYPEMGMASVAIVNTTSFDIARALDRLDPLLFVE
jgi:CubicO group peptidase (beta-lactamase class C family)